ncbi:MAG: response regulator [Oscillospiraceae bacterium]|nr:response regulator [Oscillospiraceae bacterium]
MGKDKILKILLVEDEPNECAAISRCIDQSDGIRLIGITNSIEKAFADVRDCLPDAVILDIELHKGDGDGITFLERLYACDILKPFILVTTDNTSRLIYERVRELGADFIIAKNQESYCAEYVVDFLMSMKSTILFRKMKQGVPEELLTLDNREEITKRILKRIDTELDLIGIKPNVLGRMYIVEAIQMMMVRPEPNFCYYIGKKYGKSSQSVDHAMTNAINKAWSNSPIEEIQKLYTAKVDIIKGYPTYSEFVYYYARKIKNDL